LAGLSREISGSALTRRAGSLAIALERRGWYSVTHPVTQREHNVHTEACLMQYFHRVGEWPIWEQFRLIDSQPSKSGDVFTFANFIAALALLLVVMIAADFRYRYRLSLTRRNLRRIGYWVGLGVGVSLLSTDLWYQNNLPIPQFLANPNNLKAALGFVFLAFVFRAIYVAVVHPPVFTRANAKQFFDSNYYFVHEGNADRLQVVAEETRRSLPRIFALASKFPVRMRRRGKTNAPNEHDYARNFLSLIGDRRFCRIVVDREPSFSFAFFEAAKTHQSGGLPIFQFARNVGQEFIRNTNSAFYQEDSGYYSGLVGYTRPLTNIIFGSYEFVERCAADGESPLDTDHRDYDEFNATQQKGFARASLAFLESYLKATGGLTHPHSYALTRMFGSLDDSLGGVYQLDGIDSVLKMPAYGRLQATVGFVKSAIDLADKHAKKPNHFRIDDPGNDDIFDRIARLIFEIITAAANVSSSDWTAWFIQHNIVWSAIFSFRRTTADKIIALKVRRLLYNEIKEMNEFVNFKGARILGYCLNVLGLTLVNRRTSHRRQDYTLQAVVLSWTKANYKRLLADYPNVAKACLLGSVSYDAEKHSLVKTYSGDMRREAVREYLELD
jgi:hypothetical protein